VLIWLWIELDTMKLYVNMIVSFNWKQWDNGCGLHGYGKCLEWNEIVHEKYDETIKLGRWKVWIILSDCSIDDYG
jgi:hypothetical protein